MTLKNYNSKMNISGDNEHGNVLIFIYKTLYMVKHSSCAQVFLRFIVEQIDKMKCSQKKKKV